MHEGQQLLQPVLQKWLEPGQIELLLAFQQQKAQQGFIAHEKKDMPALDNKACRRPIAK
jgi:hypothetical protein